MKLNNIKSGGSKKTLLVLLSFLALYIIWGSTYLAIKVIVETAPPFLSMGIRFIGAAIILSLFLPFIKGLVFNGREIFTTSLLGVLYFAGCMGLVAWAEKSIPSGITCVIAGLLPVWYLVFDIIINKRNKPSIIVWLGVVSGMAGIVVLVGLNEIKKIDSIPILPVLAVMFSSILWAFTAMLSNKVKKPKNSILNVIIQMLAGGIANIIISSFTNELADFSLEVFNVHSVIALLYLMLFGSVIVLMAFNYLLDNVSAGLISTYSYVNPIVALLLGWLILNEEITIQIILASGLIIIGIAFIKFGDKTKKVTRLRTRRIIKKVA